jgi:hypothetical protein
MGTDPPLVLDNGSQLCLSFLTRQGCWSSCRRSNTHAVPLNPNEKQQVINYLKTKLQKRNFVTPQAQTPTPTPQATQGGALVPP